MPGSERRQLDLCFFPLLYGKTHTIEKSMKHADGIYATNVPISMTIPTVLWKFARENPASSALYMVTLALIPIQSVLLPHLYGRVVNAIQERRALVRPFVYVMVVIAVLQLGWIFAEWNEVCHTYPALMNQIRKDIMIHTFQEHETNYEEQQTAVLVAKMVKIPSVLYNLVDQYKMVLIPQAVVCASIVFYFLKYDAPLALVVGVAIAYVIVVVNAAPVACTPYSTKREQIVHDMFEETDDIFRNMMAIFNLNTIRLEERNIDTMHARYKGQSWATLKCIMTSKLMIIPIILATYAFFMWRCYKLSQRRGAAAISTGTFVSLFMIMLSLFGGLNSYMNQVKELVLRKGIMNTYFDDDSMKSAMMMTKAKANNGIQKITGQGDDGLALEARNVTYIYPNTTTNTLKDFTLRIPKGQKVLVRGRIGCGKSTLLKLFMSYKLPTYGELYLNGVPYSELSPALIRSQIGYIPQNPVLFNRTIYENIVYGFSPQEAPTKEQVLALLSDLQVTFPEGLDAPVGKNGSKLSGGQRQIVWILRVMLQDPAILLMDEPTAAIDPRTKTIVQRLLEQVMRPAHGLSRTVVMVAHDQDDNIRAFDRVVTLEAGQILKDREIHFVRPP